MNLRDLLKGRFLFRFVTREQAEESQRRLRRLLEEDAERRGFRSVFRGEVRIEPDEDDE